MNQAALFPLCGKCDDTGLSSAGLAEWDAKGRPKYGELKHSLYCSCGMGQVRLSLALAGG